MNSVLENFNVDVFVEAIMEDGEAKGIKIGEERGIKIGEANGIKIGEANGRAQGLNNMTEIYELLKSGMSPDDILARGYSKEYVDLAKKMMDVK